MDPDLEDSHRNIALAVAGRLPVGREEALLVLELAREIVQTFLYPEPAEPARQNLPANVVAFRARD